ALLCVGCVHDMGGASVIFVAFSGTRGPLTVHDARVVTDTLEALRSESFARRTSLIVYVGCAAGVDAVVRAWCGGAALPCSVFTADWKRYGRRAGSIRNGWIVDAARDTVNMSPANETRAFAFPGP